jgi:VIT1/CCC1 family predicted Fe2+/Mn2+ transporter
MDLARKIGIGVTMLIPAFVLSGVAWQFVHSWIAVLIMLIIVGAGYWSIVTGRLFQAKKRA